MKVLKFGGTSVGSARRMKNVVSIISGGEPKIVVLSAMAGTTNSLVDITRCFYRKEVDEANKIITRLEQAYAGHIEDLYTSVAYKEKALVSMKYGRLPVLLLPSSMKRWCWRRVN